MKLPDPSLSISAIIFLISSFFGSNPRALIATYRKPWQKELVNRVLKLSLFSIQLLHELFFI
jgi:hypothetical protein